MMIANLFSDLVGHNILTSPIHPAANRDRIEGNMDS